MKQYDVTALGELLIDFTENGTSAQGNPLFDIPRTSILREFIGGSAFAADL